MQFHLGLTASFISLSNLLASPLDDHFTFQQLRLLGDENPRVRFNAHLSLHKALVSQPDEKNYFDTMTFFYKQAPHLCRNNQNEYQILHILHLFAAQKDISSVLLKESLLSKYESVQVTALQFIQFSDNSITSELIKFAPSSVTLPFYTEALLKDNSPEAQLRFKELQEL